MLFSFLLSLRYDLGLHEDLSEEHNFDAEWRREMKILRRGDPLPLPPPRADGGRTCERGRGRGRVAREKGAGGCNVARGGVARGRTNASMSRPPPAHGA